MTVATTVSCGQGPALAKVQREDAHDLVAVDDVAAGVHGQAPVGVAVVADAQVRLMLDDRSLQVLQMGGAVPVVDVEPVRIGADDGDVGAGLPEGPRRDHRGRTVGGVDDHMHPVEPVRHDGEQVIQVARGTVGQGAHPAHVRPDRLLVLAAHPLLDEVLDLVGDLVPAARQELDAVVGHRVVRGREHHPQVGAQVSGQEGDRRGGQHPGVVHVDARGGQACHHRGAEELARGSPVGADERARPVALELARVAEHVRRGDGQVERQLCGHVAVGEAPDPVGPEQPTHAVSACCTGEPCAPSSGPPSCAPERARPG